MPSPLSFPTAQGSGEDPGERICYENRLAESERSDSEKSVHRQYRQGRGRGPAVQLFYRYSSGLGVLVTDFELLVNRPRGPGHAA
jgi:hypothetical protein